MAVVVNATTVIDNSRKLVNIAGPDGKSDNFQPNVTTISPASSVTVSMNAAFLDITLTGNTTLTVSDKALGKTSIVAIDTSSSGHTPTFDSNVKWPADSQPIWADHRYWNVALVAWDGTIVRASAVGYDS